MAEEVQLAAAWLLRYSLVLVIAWIGGMKFTALEAAGIQPLVGSSPFLSWMYRLWSVQVVSNLFGVAEISIATMIAVRPWAPKASALGSGLAVVMFVTTLSFLFSLLGWDSRRAVFQHCRMRAAFCSKIQFSSGLRFGRSAIRWLQ